MLKILHFSDTHIDMANHGKRDPKTGLPIRVGDYLTALDKIIDHAINTPVDLVIFSGDAYRDRTPVPTFQREWGKRIKRLSEAKVATLLLIGNHDISPAYGRAHALQEFETLEIPYVKVISKPEFFTPDTLYDLPVQVIGIPWLSRSAFIASQEASAVDMEDVTSDIEMRVTAFVQNCLDNCNPDLPIIFTTHASIQGALYGGERFVMLGKDQVFSGGLVRNPIFDYVALGHIHKPQDLNEGQHPPVIYPGSIERVDFGEAKDQKFFVVADVNKGETKVNWIPLNGRKFLDHYVDLRKIHKHGFAEDGLPQPEAIRAYLEEYLPEKAEIQNAIARLRLLYPRDWEALIDDQWIRDRYEDALEFQLVHKPIVEARLRLPEDQDINMYPPEELLSIYWKSQDIDEEELKILQGLAAEIIHQEEQTESAE